MSDEIYYNIHETAKLLEIEFLSQRSKKQLMRTLELKFEKCGNEVKYDYECIQALMNQVTNFYQKYISGKDALTFEGVTRDKLQVSNIEKIRIPQKYGCILQEKRCSRFSHDRSVFAYNRNQFLLSLPRFQRDINNKREISNFDCRDYVTRDGASKILDMTNARDSMKSTSLDKLDVRTIKQHNGNLYNIEDLKTILYKAKNYYENYYYIYEILKIENMSYSVIRKYKLEFEEMPKGYQYVMFDLRFSCIEELNYSLKVIKKCEFDTWYKKNKKEENVIDLLDYTLLEDVAKMLELETVDRDFSSRTLKTLGVESFTIQNELYYKTEDIQEVVRNAEQFFKEYYLSHELKEIVLDEFKIIKYLNIDIKKVPKGYNSIFKRRRFGDKCRKRSYLGYKKYQINLSIDDGLLLTKKIKANAKYVIKNGALEILGISELSNGVKLLKKLDISTFKLGNKVFYDINNIKTVYADIKLFFESHYVIDYVYNNLNSNQLKYLDINTVRIPHGYYEVMYYDKLNYEQITHQKAYKKEEIDKCLIFFKNYDDNSKKWEGFKIIDEIDIKSFKVKNIKFAELNSKKSKRGLKFISLTGFKKNNSANYLNLEQSIELTNLSNDYLRKTLNKQKKAVLIDKNKRLMINKNHVLTIVKLQEDFFMNYIDVKSAIMEFPKLKHNDLAKLKTYEAPMYAYTKNRYLSIIGIKGVHSISDVKKCYKKKVSKIVHSTLTTDDPYETFLLRLKNQNCWHGFSKESRRTELVYFTYVKSKLCKHKSVSRYLSSKINLQIKTAIHIKDILDKFDKKEIYNLKSSEINLYIKGIERLTYKKNFLEYFKKAYSEYLASGDDINNCFKISKLVKLERYLNDVNSETNEQNKLYSFEEYEIVFDYLIDIDAHVQEAISEIAQKGTVSYASTWLYAILHLNNAWRHGDVCNFPSIEIDDLILEYKIHDYTWFNRNKINMVLSRRIVSRISQWEFVISKTKMKGRFFCSDRLSISLSSAVVLLTLYQKQYEIHISSLMNFNTKFNEVTGSQLRKLFKKISIENFKFASLKFNKSVMTFITYLANLTNDNKSIEYAQFMRGHQNINSTQHYVNYDVKTVERLSELLFRRGEFGYIPKMLMQRLNEDGLNVKGDSLDNSGLLVKSIGGVFKLNSIIAFINSVKNNETELREYIGTKSYSECQMLLTNIYTNKLPSKDDISIQCLKSNEKCQNIEEEDCFVCKFHIPSIYALNILCERLVSSIEEYTFEISELKKHKLAQKILTYRNLIIESIKVYGKEYVYGSLDISRSELLDKLASIEMKHLEYNELNLNAKEN